MRKLVLASFVVVMCACSGEGPGGGTGGGTGGTGGGANPSSSCTTATLFAGNPLHDDPMARPTDGTGLLADPPLLYRQVVFSSGQLLTHVGQEIWRASLTDRLLHKVAGTERNQQALTTGPCAQARFANIFHIAVASDGALFVSDQTANAILKVTDPLGPGCSVERWAGAAMDYAEGSLNPSNPPNVGDVDGPGVMAKFSLPERMALDASDNIYVWDEGNNAIRKIANDAAHTVSTFVDAIAPNGAAVVSQTFMNGTLYVWGTEGNDVFLNAYDASGTKTVLLKGRPDLFGGASGDSKTLGTIVNDGSSLIVYFTGQLFRIGTDGKVSAPLAGVYKPGLDFTSGYDPKASQPADKVQLLALSQGATAGLNAWVTLDENKDLYVSARADNSYVQKIDCN
ncbi:MAG: hypothetical protein JNK82_43685 [Myxococcaceae bacterium]|nr:hypothetical protein [Myxococcaceae bacterium]